MYRKPKQQAIQKERPKVQTRSEIKQRMQTNSIASKGTKKKSFKTHKNSMVIKRNQNLSTKKKLLNTFSCLWAHYLEWTATMLCLRLKMRPQHLIIELSVWPKPVSNRIPHKQTSTRTFFHQNPRIVRDYTRLPLLNVFL